MFLHFTGIISFLATTIYTMIVSKYIITKKSKKNNGVVCDTQYNLPSD